MWGKQNNYMLALALCFTASAARADIITDRPDVAESSETVGAGRFQVEAGASLDAADDGDTLNMSTPLKLRLGITDGFELHLETPGLTVDRETSGAGEGDTRAGFGAVDLGFKVHFTGGGGVLPSTGLLLAVTLPSGGAEDAPLALSPTLAMDWEITHALGAGANVGLTFNLEAGATHAVRYALAVGRTLDPLTDRLRLYGEVSGESPMGDGDHEVWLGGGVSFLITPDLQLDAAASAGMTDATPMLTAGVGVSYKI